MNHIKDTFKIRFLMDIIGDYKDLIKRTASDKVLLVKSWCISKKICFIG